MKKLTLHLITLVIALFSIANNANAQTTVTVSASSPWIGYMNWFDLSNNYLNGGFWGVPALKTTVNPGSNTVTFQPNFNTVGDAISSGDPGALAFWTNGAGGGSKIMDALTFIEPSGVGGQTVTFMGSVNSNTISAAYTGTVFIKILDPNIGYAQTAFISAPIGATGSTFSISLAIPASPANLITQYGVSIKGINANPSNEAALGSIILGQLFPLPLTLTSFDAKNINESVQLKWVTKSEVNVNSFDIEKSLDGKMFETLANVKATNNETNEYSVNDNNFFNTTYYRLKMIDEDGKFSYSKIEKVMKLQDDEVSLYPNPSSNSINIISKNQSAIMYSIFGNAIQKIKLNDGITNIDISTLKTGNYIIHFSKGQVVNFTKK